MTAVQERVAAIVAAAPVLTDEQAANLARLLKGAIR